MLQLRRITSGASWIPQIDGLRFVAIIGVLLFHIRGEVMERGFTHVALPVRAHVLDGMVANGDRGVGLFFVISGFILARPFLRQHRLGGKPVRAAAYYLRRVTRLEPPYILSLLLYTAAAALAFHIALRKLLPHLLASIFYLHNPIYARQSDISFVTWSLEVEVQFYLLAPLLGNLYRIPNTVWRRIMLAALTIGWGVIACLSTPWMRFGIFEQMQYFLAGLLLADLLEYPRYTNRESWAWDAVSVIGWPIIFLLPHSRPVLSFLPVLVVPVYLAAFHGKASNWFFRQPLIALTGGMCYSIYLTHMLLISVAFRAVKHLRFAGDGSTYVLQAVLLTLLVLLGSTIFFVLVERPCMDPNWPGKLAKRLRRTLGGAHPVAAKS